VQGGESAGLDGLDERLVVAVVLLCISLGERENRSVEDIAASKVGGDGDATA